MGREKICQEVASTCSGGAEWSRWDGQNWMEWKRSEQTVGIIFMAPIPLMPNDFNRHGLIHHPMQTIKEGQRM